MTSSSSLQLPEFYSSHTLFPFLLQSQIHKHVRHNPYIYKHINSSYFFLSFFFITTMYLRRLVLRGPRTLFTLSSILPYSRRIYGGYSSEGLSPTTLFRVFYFRGLQPQGLKPILYLRRLILLRPRTYSPLRVFYFRIRGTSTPGPQTQLQLVPRQTLGGSATTKVRLLFLNPSELS